LYSASAGKTDYEEESKESFSHGGERKQTAGLQSTHFQRATHFPRRTTANDCNFALGSARNNGALAELKI
jgi:hypothetical protein